MDMPPWSTAATSATSAAWAGWAAWATAARRPHRTALGAHHLDGIHPHAHPHTPLPYDDSDGATPYQRPSGTHSRTHPRTIAMTTTGTASEVPSAPGTVSSAK